MKDSKEKDDIDTSTLEQFNLKELLINYRVFIEELEKPFYKKIMQWMKIKLFLKKN